jgi:iron(III) transport system substrate-binding protein
MTRMPTRRAALKTLLGSAALVAVARQVGAAPEAGEVAPALVAAAEKEGAVTFVTAADIALAQKIANAFEAKYPAIKVAAERNGSERIFQRLDQEYASGIYRVDVVDSADAAHFIVWKRNGWLAPYVPAEVARHWPEDERDPDGMFQTFRASLSIMGMNTRLVRPEDAPKSYQDLLDPKWRGKLVKGHPGYSGTIATTTYLLAQHFGWSYLEQLAKQRVMQVQSATEPPKKIALGERAVMVEGSDYVLYDQRDKGSPVEAIYPIEGTPIIPIPTAVMAKAPHPNAARLFQSFLYTLEAQQMLVDVGNSRAFHPQAREKPGRKTLAELALWRADPAALLDAYEEVRRKYTEIFGT